MTSFDWKVCLILPAISCAFVFGQDVLNVRGCPSDMVVGTDTGKDIASVEWNEPKFIDTEEQRVIPLRSHAPGDKFLVGETTVRYTAYYMGAKAMCAFNVLVQDVEPPVVENCPQSIATTTDPGEPFASGVSWEPPTASDNIRLVEFNANPPIGTRFQLGVNKVTYRAMDAQGNKGECSFNVIVEDRENPTLERCPDNMVINVDPTDTLRAANWTEPQSRDNSEVARVSSTHESGSMFPLGTTNVRYTVEDFSGNIGGCSFFVTLRVRVPDSHIFIRNFTTSTIDIAWPESADPTSSSYLIYAWPAGEAAPPASDHTYQAIGRQESFAWRKLESLKPGTEYNIKVTVTGPQHNLSTKQRTKPSPPHNVSIKPGSVTPVSFTLLWKPGKGSFGSMTISVRRMWDRSPVFEESVGNDENYFQITGLEPNTAYEVSIFSVSGYAQDMTKSEEVTLIARTAELPPSGILIQEVTSDSITIVGRANDAGDDADDDYDDDAQELRGMETLSHEAHVVFIFSDKTDLFTDVVFNRDALRYTFRGLKPVTDYKVRVVNNQNGIAFETNSTTNPSPVTDLFISSITDSSATVQWTHAVGPRDRYEITISPIPTRMRKTAPIRTKNDDITFSHLEAGTTYTMRVVTTKGQLRSEVRTLVITPGVDRAVSMYRARESTCISPIVACGFLGAVLLVGVVYFAAVFLFKQNIPQMVSLWIQKLRNHESERENEYENPSQHQYSSYLNSLNNRIAQMRRPESNNYNLPPIHRVSRTFSRLPPRRTRPHNNLHRTQSESVIYYNLGD